MTVEVEERNKIAELLKTEEIIELRKRFKEENEMIYEKGGIESLISMLSGLCSVNVYDCKEIETYFEILETRDFLKEKYTELSDIESSKYNGRVELGLNEANEELDFLKSYLS